MTDHTDLTERERRLRLHLSKSPSGGMAENDLDTLLAARAPSGDTAAQALRDDVLSLADGWGQGGLVPGSSVADRLQSAVENADRLAQAPDPDTITAWADAITAWADAWDVRPLIEDRLRGAAAEALRDAATATLAMTYPTSADPDVWAAWLAERADRIEEQRPKGAQQAHRQTSKSAQVLAVIPDTSTAMREAVERSSLGTPDAVAARASVSDEDAARIVGRAEQMEADTSTATVPVEVYVREPGPEVTEVEDRFGNPYDREGRSWRARGTRLFYVDWRDLMRSAARPMHPVGTRARLRDAGGEGRG